MKVYFFQYAIKYFIHIHLLPVLGFKTLPLIVVMDAVFCRTPGLTID